MLIEDGCKSGVELVKVRCKGVGRGREKGRGRDVV
jgi:hypothetical protein